MAEQSLCHPFFEIDEVFTLLNQPMLTVVQKYNTSL